MSIALTFVDKDLLKSALVGPDGAVHYTTNTTSGVLGDTNRGFLGRKETTITAANGLVGLIDWREKRFVINGVWRGVHGLRSRSGGIFSSEREWIWGSVPYRLKYHDAHRVLLATPNVGSVAGTVRFTTYQRHLVRTNEAAVIYFPHQIQDEIERMFLLMAILETETHRQDEQKAQDAVG
ncbi:hypothetical protein DFH07DRAFT_947935 [Mycena maculata]|uniref:Uncharacterized protein n=1 Tax=Mycena maculata TaxID=230809 RepID=A0AAD7KHL3_9AGAR|nr:hypothetical protein DFH07DRAFT_947935 [Mycena maculata]